MNKNIIDKKIQAFDSLAKIFSAVANNQLNSLDKNLVPLANELNKTVDKIHDFNPWFIQPFVKYQLNALADSITSKNIELWLKPYYNKLISYNNQKTVAIIMAGNIPLVDFHDIVAAVFANHKILLKPSSKDSQLPKITVKILTSLLPEYSELFTFADDILKNYSYDAVIATGSDNSARYFNYYFRNIPHIIRKNRTSVAVIHGNESQQDLEKLADDVFLHFGLGCRNVSKIFIPKNFDLNRLFKAFFKYKFVIDNHKYANNYTYNKAIYLLNKEKFFDNGFVMLKPDDTRIVSPTAVVFYQEYLHLNSVHKFLQPFAEKIQCIVSNQPVPNLSTIPLGTSQKPMLWDYPDNIDTMNFLLSL